MTSETDPGERGRLFPPRPVVGVAGLVFQGSSALLVKRAKDPGRGQWSIPGGAVRVGEGLQQALIREMTEEVGLFVRVGPLVEVIERILVDPDGKVRYHYVVLDYLCQVRSGDVTPGSDADDARFAPPEEWRALGLDDLAVTILEKARGMENGAGLNEWTKSSMAMMRGII